MIGQVLSWVLMGMGVLILRLAGRERTRLLAWSLGVGNQFIWGVYSITTQHYGFVIGSLFFGAAYIGNLREEMRCRRSPSHTPSSSLTDPR